MIRGLQRNKIIVLPVGRGDQEVLESENINDTNESQ